MIAIAAAIIRLTFFAFMNILSWLFGLIFGKNLLPLITRESIPEFESQVEHLFVIGLHFRVVHVPHGINVRRRCIVIRERFA